MLRMAVRGGGEEDDDEEVMVVMRRDAASRVSTTRRVKRIGRRWAGISPVAGCSCCCCYYYIDCGVDVDASDSKGSGGGSTISSAASTPRLALAFLLRIAGMVLFMIVLACLARMSRDCAIPSEYSELRYLGT